MKHLKPFIVSILLAEAAGLFGSLFTFSAIPQWYATLQRPTFAPPNWLFGPVWTLLFLLMGIAAALIWSQTGAAANKKIALWFYGGQLVLNALWSVIFFGFHQLGWALAELVVLWAAIITTTVLFFRLNKTAAYVLLPYLAWVTFAGFLNLAFWKLNQA